MCTTAGGTSAAMTLAASTLFVCGSNSVGMMLQLPHLSLHGPFCAIQSLYEIEVARIVGVAVPARRTTAADVTRDLVEVEEEAEDVGDVVDGVRVVDLKDVEELEEVEELREVVELR